MMQVGKIRVWIEENSEAIAEFIPIKTCPSHEDGMETCWGQDGHIWKDGHHQIMTVCHPRAKEVFE